MKEKERSLGIFEKYLTLWVALCILLGVMLGQWIPAFPKMMSKLEISRVSIPVAILIWLMIYPMMLQIDFASIKRSIKKPKGLAVTLVVNWAIKPFTMLLLSWLFLKYIFAPYIGPALGSQYVAGAILLGAAPCTAMVFVWSYLTKGDPAYTLVQVAINDIVILFLYAPIVIFQLGVAKIQIPYDTVLLSVVLFVVIPLTLGYYTRKIVIQRKGMEWFEEHFLPSLKPWTIIGLLLTLILLFSYQGDVILKQPLHILFIAIPLTIQTYLIFFIGYLWAKAWKLEHAIAAPAGMIGASNFFELAVAVAISLFGLSSGAALATVVGVLEEVPIMLSLVYIANRTRYWFPEPAERVKPVYASSGDQQRSDSYV